MWETCKRYFDANADSENGQNEYLKKDKWYYIKYVLLLNEANKPINKLITYTRSCIKI